MSSTTDREDAHTAMEEYRALLRAQGVTPPSGAPAPAAPPPAAPPPPPDDPPPTRDFVCKVPGCGMPMPSMESLIDHLARPTAHTTDEMVCPYCDRLIKRRALRNHVVACPSNPHRVHKKRGRPRKDQNQSQSQSQSQAPPPPTLPLPPPTPAPTAAPIERTPFPLPPEPRVAAALVDALIAGMEAGVLPLAMVPRVLEWAEEGQAIRAALNLAQWGHTSTSNGERAHG